MKAYTRLADAFTPMLKPMSSEYCNSLAYDAIQIFGGSGYMKDYPIERIYRDARITNIYEGTSRLQVVAAIRHVTTGTYLAQIKEYEAQTYEQKHLHEKLVALREQYEQSVQKVVSAENNEFIDFHARRMVEIAAHIIISYLLMRRTGEVEDYRNSAELYVKYAEAQNSAAARYIESSTLADLDLISAVKEEEALISISRLTGGASGNREDFPEAPLQTSRSAAFIVKRETRFTQPFDQFLHFLRPFDVSADLGPARSHRNRKSASLRYTSSRLSIRLLEVCSGSSSRYNSGEIVRIRSSSVVSVCRSVSAA